MAHRTASVLFFGSARAKDREGWEKAVAKAEEELAAATDDESRKVQQSTSVPPDILYRLVVDSSNHALCRDPRYWGKVPESSSFVAGYFGCWAKELLPRYSGPLYIETTYFRMLTCFTVSTSVRWIPHLPYLLFLSPTFTRTSKAFDHLRWYQYGALLLLLLLRFLPLLLLLLALLWVVVVEIVFCFCSWKRVGVAVGITCARPLVGVEHHRCCGLHDLPPS